LNDLNDVLYSHCIYPDTGIQWDLLYAVIAHVNEDFVCPICLFPPVAPRFTPCGHIMCADCFHLLLYKEESPKCPICLESLLSYESIRAIICYHDKSPVRFVKVVRNNSYCILNPNNQFSNTLRKSSDPYHRLNRFSICDEKFVSDIISQESDAILTQKCIYSEEVCNEKQECLNRVLKEVQNETNTPDSSVFFLFNESESDQSSTFFVPEDGRLIFIDPLSLKMLESEYGNINRYPNTFEAPVISSSSITIDDSNRHFRPEFAHLPSGAEVQVSFLDLSKVVSNRVLNSYKNQISSRTKANIKKPPPKKRIITKKDFQTFLPLAPEPVIDLRNEVSFPSLNPNESSKNKPEDSFPSLTNSVSKTKKAPGWGNIKI